MGSCGEAEGQEVGVGEGQDRAQGNRVGIVTAFYSKGSFKARESSLAFSHFLTSIICSIPFSITLYNPISPTKAKRSDVILKIVKTSQLMSILDMMPHPYLPLMKESPTGATSWLKTVALPKIWPLTRETCKTALGYKS